MMRIVAGRAGGCRLNAPPGRGTRPTSERVREALFSRLDHLGLLEDSRVLDLYAGSGALGLEAGSRGASSVVLVEQQRAAAAVARGNAATVAKAVAGAGASLDTVVRAEPVRRVLASEPGAPFDLVLIDPPYHLTEPELAGDLELLVERAWLSAEAVVVVERSVRTPEPTWPTGLVRFSEKRYGETIMWFAGPAASCGEG